MDDERTLEDKIIYEKQCEIEKLKKINKIMEANERMVREENERLREKGKMVFQACICIVVSVAVTLLCNYFFKK